jgi:primosomal protein N'
MTGQNQIAFKETTYSHWAHIVLPLALPVVYTYAIPDLHLERALPGCRVEVTFSPSDVVEGRRVGE